MPRSITPQQRTALLRKLGNMFPGCSVVFVGEGLGLRFQLVDERGRERTNLVEVLSCLEQGRVTESNVHWAIKREGPPAGGFPSGF
jgi:hypothetical protein